MQTYPLKDRPTLAERETLGLTTAGMTSTERAAHIGWVMANVRAVPTGEKREPKAGEWYLSGAIIEAYRAPADLASRYRICKLCLTEQVTTTKIVRVQP